VPSLTGLADLLAIRSLSVALASCFLLYVKCLAIFHANKLLCCSKDFVVLC
jgi:hypothetical protein